MYIFELVIVLLFLLIFSVLSYKKKLLNLEGVLIANAVGLAAITYGPTPLIDFLAVVLFFVVGEIASNYPKKKHSERGIWNVVGNSLSALAILSLVVIYPEHALVFEIGFFGAIAAALADTLSSEVGYYSKSKPIMITTLEKVPRGTDGGITLLGEIAGLIGGILIAIVYFLINPSLIIFFAIIIAGFIGTNIDSLFGAVFETKKVLNNTHVNLVCGLAGALFAFLVGLLI